ncbi:hypothetical protein HPP92_000200 [Vanilla planifolia]|uniref:Cyclin-like domain-containing protein n=1 Tax=Vanilla planifolia TaxID=51239 RepID=A0A835RU07_VANPL|nr:hypothetical protein HPP92_000200 [Vanilla planifolia]
MSRALSSSPCLRAQERGCPSLSPSAQVEGRQKPLRAIEEEKVMSCFSLFDHLYCQEEYVAEETEKHFSIKDGEEDERHWRDSLSSLLGKEEENRCELSVIDSYVGSPRKSAVDWVIKAGFHHGFSTQTVLLAVNYLDRCFLSASGLRLHGEKPWMGRLAAVACLSLAAKVEETRVPLLLDLQLSQVAGGGESIGYLFEGRTIKRMELLVLSTLGWRMNPVTPLSLVRLFLLKIPAMDDHHRDVSSICEAALMAVISDWRWVLYTPSVLATAALLHATSPENNLPLNLLNVSKEKVGDAFHLISEHIPAGNDECKQSFGKKRRPFILGYCCYSPSSPNGVVDSCFSSDSWEFRPTSASSSLEQPPFKKPNARILSEDGESKDVVLT